MDIGQTEELSKYKLRIFAQATVYQKRAMPKKEMQQMESGLMVAAQNWYDEFDCPQLAVNYNGLYITERDLDKLTRELCEAIKKTVRDKGLIIA